MKKCLLLCLVLLVAQFASAQSVTPAPKKPSLETFAIADDGTPLQWTVYKPKGEGPWPAVLVIHGGLFRSGSPDQPYVTHCAKDLSKAGFIAFAIEYRLAPRGSLPGQVSDGRFPDQYNDVTLAVLAARNDPRANGQVGSVGGSSGATHTAWVASHGQPGADRIDVGVGFSGAYDFSDFTPDDDLLDFIRAVTNYVGVPQRDIDGLGQASPSWNLDGETAPLFLLDSEGDLMPAVQLQDMVAALEAIHAPDYKAITLPGRAHGLANWPREKNDAISFLQEHFATQQ